MDDWCLFCIVAFFPFRFRGRFSELFSEHVYCIIRLTCYLFIRRRLHYQIKNHIHIPRKELVHTNRPLNPYEQFIVEIMDRVKFVRTDTIVRCLCNCFKRVWEADALHYLRDVQRMGYVILSEDGWCLTKARYRLLCNDKDFENIKIDADFRLSTIKGLNIRDYDTNIADCMMVIADMMPLSANFIVGASPWYLEFIAKTNNEEKGRLFQVTTFRKGEEEAMGEVIATLERKKSEELRKQIRRIAILDDESMTWAVPKLGFSNICVLDTNEDSGLRIVEHREQDECWDEYPE